MESVFTEKLIDGGLGQYVHPSGFQCDVGGTSVTAIPPGKADFSCKVHRPMLNVIPSSPSQMAALRHNGQDVRNTLSDRNGSLFFGAETELEVHCINQEWELLIEMDAARLEHVDAERLENVDLDGFEFLSRTDPVASALGQMAIAHLRESVADSLYIEGLSIALFARTMGSAVSGRMPISVVGTDKRVDRAIDYIRADLTGPMTIADLAKIACMSPSWFSRAFRAQTGMTVHTYVQERRLERASLLLQTGTDSLASIAWDCGFADHSHLTRLFRKRYGVTPSAVRAG